MIEFFVYQWKVLKLNAEHDSYRYSKYFFWLFKQLTIIKKNNTLKRHPKTGFWNHKVKRSRYLFKTLYLINYLASYLSLYMDKSKMR